MDDGFGYQPQWTIYSTHQIEDLTSNMVLGRISYGAYETVDVFACVGLSDATDDMTEVPAFGSSGNKYTGMESGHGLAYGLGARATFWQEGDIIWGGLVQILWENPGEGDIDMTPSDDPNMISGDMEIDLQEIQVAVGPTVQMKGFSVYGGPFLHFVTGDLDVEVRGKDKADEEYGVKLSQDIREKSEFGFFAGGHGEVSRNTSWFVEFQITGDAWGVGVGGVRRF